MTEKQSKSSEKHASHTSKSHEKEIHGSHHKDSQEHEVNNLHLGGHHNSWFNETAVVYGIIALTVLLVLNQWQYLQLASAISGGSSMTISQGATSGKIGSLDIDSMSVLGPAHLSLLGNEPPALPGYGSKVTKFPTISEHVIPASTGDAVQDAINALVPKGTPWYGQEAGVSFDDPINSLKRWNQVERQIQLSPEEEQRWGKIISLFTCDFCCGSPQSPTRISQCGCSHAGAWKGVAKFFVKNYGDKYSNDQLLGEGHRWYAIWYPKGMLEDYLLATGKSEALPHQTHGGAGADGRHGL